MSNVSKITLPNGSDINIKDSTAVRGLSSGTNQNNLVKWGSDGYTVADAGVAIQSDTISTQDNTKVPTNKAVASFVNSSVATNTANFVGTYKSLAELQAVQNPTNNDYGFVSTVDSAILTTSQPADWTTNYTDYYTYSGGVYTPVTGSSAPTWQANTYYKADNLIFSRYKYVASSSTWTYEYELNNSSFTAAEWDTIQSGLSANDKEKLDSLATIKYVGSGLGLNGTTGELTADVIGVKGDSESNYRTGNVNITKSNIGLGNVTNDAQVKKISSSTSGNIMTWSGTTGDTPADSGVSIETSSSGISDSDAKIPTSKDIRNNAAGIAKLTGYTKATGDVAATDTITTAIGKLETKADNNTTNIGKVQTQANWNTNNGVKNLATENNFSNTGYYKDVPVDGSLTGNVAVYIGNIISTDTDANQCAVLFIYTDYTSSAIHLVNRGTASSFSVNLEEKVLKSVRIYSSDNYVHSSGDTVTVTNLMVCPKSLYDADSTYEPYALPNTKITPELIELVDSGAKNLVNSTSGSGTRWIDIPVDIPAGEYAVSFATLSTTWEVSANQLQISFMDSNYDIVTDGYTYINYTTKNGVYKLNDTCKIIRLYASPTSVSGKVVTYTNMMICTKAAWDVSQKFVPYRPTYAETVAQVAENETNISTNERLGYLKNYNLSPIIGGHLDSAGIIDRKECFLLAGTYYVSWKNSGAANSGTATMTFYDYNDTSVGQATITHSRTRTEVSVTLTDDCEAIELTNDSNVYVGIIQVMITTMANQSFVPYAPSNAELYVTIGNINTVLEGVL